MSCEGGKPRVSSALQELGRDGDWTHVDEGVEGHRDDAHEEVALRTKNRVSSTARRRERAQGGGEGRTIKPRRCTVSQISVRTTSGALVDRNGPMRR